MPLRPEPLNLPFPVLVGDIGGTNARFAQLDAPDAELHVFPTAATADYADPAEAIKAILLKHEKALPKSLVFGLAGPVTGDRIKLTNCPWIFAPKDLIAQLGVEAVVLLNDFESQALALPALQPADLLQIGGGTAVPETPKVVIGPGTGLGVCILAFADGLWIPLPGEGSHVTLAATTPRDFAIWSNLTRIGGRVTAESVLSGPGMLNLYHAIVRTNGTASRCETPADVTAAAAAGDPEAVETLSLFVQHLGCVAGDFALTALARGGVYISGGVSQRIVSALQTGPFRSEFEDKAPYRDLAASIPTFLITHPLVALVGLAAYASHPDNFGVDLKGRHWTA